MNAGGDSQDVDAFGEGDRTEDFGGGRFEADAFDWEFEGQGEALADGGEVRVDLGLEDSEFSFFNFEPSFSNTTRG